MHCDFICAAMLAIFTTTVVSIKNIRAKRNNEAVFNVLLNLYKMQPLKSSNIYKTFTNRVLFAQNHTEDLDANIKAELKDPAKENNELETFIPSFVSTEKAAFPKFGLQHESPERFAVDEITLDYPKKKLKHVAATLLKDVTTESSDFSSLLKHMGSQGTNGMHITEILAAKDSDDTNNNIVPLAFTGNHKIVHVVSQIDNLPYYMRYSSHNRYNEKPSKLKQIESNREHQYNILNLKNIATRNIPILETNEVYSIYLNNEYSEPRSTRGNVANTDIQDADVIIL